uniref:BTB domain-containing protein n=1 Tax=Arcella intermedia TaxID=1963864 RepID=A0A6B2KXM7_9EUKA
MRAIKLMVPGDGGIGKTCSLVRYTSNEFPGEYVPIVTDIFNANVISSGQTITLSLWEPGGRVDYDRLRPLTYPQTDTFFIGFSIINPTSFANVSTKWVPEIRRWMPKTPFVIGGFKMDLREDPETLKTLAAKNLSPITTQMGLNLANELGAMGYIEISSLTGKNVKEAYDLCVSVAMVDHNYPPLPPPKPELPPLWKPQISEKSWLKALRKSMRESIAHEGDIQIVEKDKVHNFHKINLVCGSQLFCDYFIKGLNGDLFEEKIDNDQLSIPLKTDRSQTWVQTHQALTPKAENGVDVDSSEGRYGHSCVVHANIMYVIGGVSKSGSYLSDVLRYNLETRSWLESLRWGKEVNYPRNNFHATVLRSDGTALVFGGKSNGYNKNLWSFNMEDESWALLATTGDVPSGRYGHTLTINGDSTKVYLFGGYENELGLSNELYVLDLATMVWSLIKTNGNMPGSRYGHFSALMKDKKGEEKLIVYAGRDSKGVLDDIWVFDLKKSKWAELPVAGEKPQGRYGFGAIVYEKELFIFGGFDGKTVVFDDIWAIPLLSSKRKWRPLGNQGFLERYYQTITLTPHGLVIFGGRRADHNMCLYVEEGTNRGKQFVIHKQRNNIKKLTLSPKIAEEGTLPVWLKEISNVSQPRKIDERVKPFMKKYGEGFSSPVTFQLNLIKFGVDSGFFSDMEVKLVDSVETAHSFYLKLNNDLLPGITKKDIEEAKDSSNPLHLPFLKEDWFKLKQYFYTRTINLTRDNYMPLLMLALKHNLELLLELTCQFMFYQLDILNTMQFGLEHNIEPVVNYALWSMKCNYSLVRDDPRFLAMPEKVKEEVTQNYWPGRTYDTALAAWRAENEKKNSNCLLQ